MTITQNPYEKDRFLEMSKLENRVSISQTELKISMFFVKEPSTSFWVFYFTILCFLFLSIISLIKLDRFGIFLFIFIIVAIPLIAIRFLTDVLMLNKTVVFDKFTKRVFITVNHPWIGKFKKITANKLNYQNIQIDFHEIQNFNLKTISDRLRGQLCRFIIKCNDGKKIILGDFEFKTFAIVIRDELIDFIKS